MRPPVEAVNMVSEPAVLDAGDLLRAEVESGSLRAEELQRVMKEGQLVPDDTMITLLKVRRVCTAAQVGVSISGRHDVGVDVVIV